MKYDEYDGWIGVGDIVEDSGVRAEKFVGGSVGVGIDGRNADVGGGSSFEESLPLYNEPIVGNLCAKRGTIRDAKPSRNLVS